MFVQLKPLNLKVPTALQHNMQKVAEEADKSLYNHICSTLDHQKFLMHLKVAFSLSFWNICKCRNN